MQEHITEDRREREFITLGFTLQVTRVIDSSL